MATPRAEEGVTAARDAAAVDADAATIEAQQGGEDVPAKSHVIDGLLPRLATSIVNAGTPELEVHLPPPQRKFEVSGHSIEKGVVLYHVHKTDCRTGIREPPILKRYTDFYNLEMNLLDTCLRVAADIPRVPRPHLRTLLRGHASEKTITIREQAFRAQLAYIATYPALHTTAVFERFLATSRTSEAGSSTELLPY
jgi:hypothetical protein